MNRREFLILSAAVATGCANNPTPANVTSSAGTATVDAGPAADYVKDGVYDKFRMQGIFIVRKGDQLYALSSICTHRHYRLEVSADNSFYCASHGSCFDQSGKVTVGPAARDLPKLPTTIDVRGHLIVKPTSGYSNG